MRRSHVIDSKTKATRFRCWLRSERECDELCENPLLCVIVYAFPRGEKREVPLVRTARSES